MSLPHRPSLLLPGLLVATACASSVPVTDPIPGSRPGLTDDAPVVAVGTIQAEVGSDLRRREGVSELAAEFLGRWGIARGVEGRLGIESETGLGGAGGSSLAVNDLELGFKLAITEGEEGSWRPSLSILPTLTLPTGADRLSSGGLEGGALLVGGWEGPGPEWTANVGGTAARGEGGRFLDLFLGLAAGGEVSPGVEVEVEVVRTLEVGGRREGPGLRHAALGTAWLVTENLQLDAWVGLEREGTERGRFIGMGISARR
jgi:hypothetical protein